MRYLKERRLISKEEVQMMLRDQETGEEVSVGGEAFKKD